MVIARSKLVICVDFNFQLDKASKPDTQKFTTLLCTTCLKQHVSVSTHRKGHTLDIVLTRETEPIHTLSVQDDILFDHNSVIFELDLVKPPLPKKLIS